MKQESSIPEKFIRLYRQKARKYKFSDSVSRKDAKTEKGQREIMGYLLVNGFISATEENLALGPQEETFIAAEHLPEHLKKTVLELVSRVPADSQLDDQYVNEKDGAETHETLEGAYINSEGRLFGVRKHREYEATVTDILDVTLKRTAHVFDRKTLHQISRLRTKANSS